MSRGRPSNNRRNDHGNRNWGHNHSHKKPVFWGDESDEKTDGEEQYELLRRFAANLKWRGDAIKKRLEGLTDEWWKDNLERVQVALDQASVVLTNELAALEAEWKAIQETAPTPTPEKTPTPPAAS